MTQQSPHNLAIWQKLQESRSPDGEHTALAWGTEISMGNPTIGPFRLSGGLELEDCNPAFIWSDDSRYLAIPQWRFMLGLQLRQRIVVVDLTTRVAFGSRPLGWLIQPLSFRNGVLLVDLNPGSVPRHTSFRIPQDLSRFRRLDGGGKGVKTSSGGPAVPRLR